MSSFPDGMTTADVSTFEAFGATTIATTERGGIGVVTTVMISEANNLATTSSRSTQSSVSLVIEII
jgi:hypothetical protein